MESIYKTDEENFSKVLYEMRKYTIKLEYLVEQQQILIHSLQDMVMSRYKIPRW